MKWNKKQVGLIAGVVCVILLIVLLLSMCKGNSSPKEPTASVESTTSVTEATNASEATAEATEETGEATEETEEATEETTEPTTGGNATPGGTGGPGLGGGTGDGTSEPETPKAGSEESPYMEVIAQFPDSVNTVAVPAEGTVHYSLSLNDESVDTYGESLLVIAAEDAYVVYNEKKYEAKDGVISVPLAARYAQTGEDKETGEPEETEEPEQTSERLPVIFRICNTGKESQTFHLQLDAPLGTVDNPEELQRGENGEFSVTAALEADDQDGYYFGIVAERDGTMLLKLDSMTENTDCDIIVTVGGNAVTLSPDALQTGVRLEFQKGDTVTVQVIAKAAEDGTIPASEVKLSGYADYYGSKTNPIPVEEDFTTEEMEPDLVLYYLVSGQNGMALNVEEPAYVIYKDKTYQAPAVEENPSEGDGEAEDTEEETVVVSVKIGNEDTSALMAIGNGGEEATAFAVTFGYPAGHVENKAPLSILDEENGIDGINTAVVDAGDTDVYWFTWTNDRDTGILTLQMPETGRWKYEVHHTADAVETIYELQCSDSADAMRSFELVTDYEDVVDIYVCTYDPADPTAMPVGSVAFEASFLQHTLINATGETLVTLDGNALVYCKQGMKYADGAIMTVVAVETDEEGNAVTDADGNVKVLTDRAYTIDYEGVVYTSQNGTVVIEGIEMESSDPDIFSILNDGEDKTTYHITFTYPEGHQSNPKAIDLGKYRIALNGDSGSGYYYQWTTDTPGTFVFAIDPSTAWSYNISSSMDTAVFASTNNGTSSDYKTEVEITIGQSHINAAENGRVTVLINLGNPSSDPENESQISFEIGTYLTKMTGDDTVTVAAGQSYPLMQALENSSASGMTITGADSFSVTYDGTEYVSENGTVTISSIQSGNTFFQITNNSSQEREYTLKLTYPVGSPENPEILQAGSWNVDLSTITEYYYTWTAPADGTFTFSIPSTGDRFKPWAYTVTHGEDVYSAQRGGKLTQTFAVASGDVVSIKLGVSGTVSTSVSVGFAVSFEEAVQRNLMKTETAERAYTATQKPDSFEMTLGEGQALMYTDLTKEYTVFVKNGYCYLSENGPAVLVDFSSDAFVNLKKLLETEELYAWITAEDGTQVKETYNALLKTYLDCAATVPVSEEETATLYPLTEDLMYILKHVGSQLGWYDSTDAAYKFGKVANANPDSVWMFSCCTVQTVTE